MSLPTVKRSVLGRSDPEGGDALRGAVAPAGGWLGGVERSLATGGSPRRLRQAGAGPLRCRGFLARGARALSLPAADLRGGECFAPLDDLGEPLARVLDEALTFLARPISLLRVLLGLLYYEIGAQKLGMSSSTALGAHVCIPQDGGESLSLADEFLLLDAPSVAVRILIPLTEEVARIIELASSHRDFPLSSLTHDHAITGARARLRFCKCTLQVEAPK